MTGNELLNKLDETLKALDNPFMSIKNSANLGHLMLWMRGKILEKDLNHDWTGEECKALADEYRALDVKS